MPYKKGAAAPAAKYAAGFIIKARVAAAAAAADPATEVGGGKKKGGVPPDTVTVLSANISPIGNEIQKLNMSRNMDMGLFFFSVKNVHCFLK